MNSLFAITLRYSLYFTLIYAISIILGNAATYFISISFLDAINVAGFMAATVFSACQFAFEQKRKPKKEERLSISIACVCLSYAVNISTFVALAYIDRIGAIDRIMNMSWGLMAVIYTITTLIYLFVVYFSFYWVTDMVLKHQKK